MAHNQRNDPYLANIDQMTSKWPMFNKMAVFGHNGNGFVDAR
jgi:hypothetical protein